MKKFLATLLVVWSLFFASTVQAEVKTYTGEGTAIAGETETHDQAVERAKGYALRDAQEKVAVYIRSFVAQNRTIELSDNEAETIAVGIVRLVDKSIEKSLVNDGVLQVRVTITVEVDTDELQRTIDELNQNRPKPQPVEKPKPQTEKPKPTDKPKPAPVEKPKPAPIERPKPVEPPSPPVSQETIKTYEGYGEYLMGEDVTLATAKQGAKDKAIRNALERAGVLIQSRSRVEDSELIEDVITSQTGAILKVVNVTYDRDDLLVKAHVLIEVDAEDLNRRLAEFARQQKH